MQSLASCLNKMVKEGYTEDFQITEQGLESLHKHSYYAPAQIEVINFFRFEGQSETDNNAILYLIETDDGTKGTLIEAYGGYNNFSVSKFMRDVESIKKRKMKN